eukprot:g18691.t1
MGFTVAQFDEQLESERAKRGKFTRKLKLLKESITTLEQGRREAKRLEKLDAPPNAQNAAPNAANPQVNAAPAAPAQPQNPQVNVAPAAPAQPQN